jgi:hypothetical protein
MKISEGEEMDQKFVNAVTMAKILGVSINWVLAHSSPSAKDRIPTIKIGRFKRFDPDQVLQWVKAANETLQDRRG